MATALRCTIGAGSGHRLRAEWVFAFIGAIFGFAAGCTLMERILANGTHRSEWERWFRYYLDAVGHTSIDRSAALADAAMDEIGKRRKG